MNKIDASPFCSVIKQVNGLSDAISGSPFSIDAFRVLVDVEGT